MGETPMVERIRMAHKHNPDPKRFDELQTAARVARDTRMSWKGQLDRQYQDAAYAPAGKRRKLEGFKRAETRAWDRFWRYLEAISPRRWESGIPCHWLIDKLTYLDAINKGALNVVPPPAWGFTEADSWRFARAVRAEGDQP